MREFFSLVLLSFEKSLLYFALQMYLLIQSTWNSQSFLKVMAQSFVESAVKIVINSKSVKMNFILSVFILKVVVVVGALSVYREENRQMRQNGEFLAIVQISLLLHLSISISRCLFFCFFFVFAGEFQFCFSPVRRPHIQFSS